MKQSKKIKAIILDLGNVVITADLYRAFAVFEQYSNYAKEEMYEKLYETSICRNFQKGISSIEQFYEDVKRAIQLRMDIKRFCEVWSDIFLFPSILPDELLKALSLRYRLVALSDTDEIHFPLIRRLFPVLSRFHSFALSFQVGAVKPMPEMYKVAVSNAGCLPEECFFVDDLEPNVQGAIKCGLQAYRFESYEKLLREFEKRGIDIALTEQL